MCIITAQQDIDAGRQGNDGHCNVLDGRNRSVKQVLPACAVSVE
jgi:hypothetical protein